MSDPSIPARDGAPDASAHRLRRYLDERRPPTPCLVVDVDRVLHNYRELTAALPGAQVRYAVKANPASDVVAALAAEGASFDVASPAEIDLCLAAGAPAGRISYGNTIKKPADIRHAHARGVPELAFDAADDLRRIAHEAPGAQVMCRLLAEVPQSAVPFGQKFGCRPEDAVERLRRAAAWGLDPAGVCFHVGSQQLDTSAWRCCIEAAAWVFRELAEHGIRLRRLNLGGGFGIDYAAEAAPGIADYAAAIRRHVADHFPIEPPELAVEPGRALVGDAGLIRSEVVLVSRKHPADEHRWVYLDVGRYNGLAETEGEAIGYAFLPVGEHAGPDGPVILAGPTCDGDDVLYERNRYRLPVSLSPGDQLDILNTGAYTASYSSVSFNGIPPLPTHCIGPDLRRRRPTADDVAAAPGNAVSR